VPVPLGLDGVVVVEPLGAELSLGDVAAGGVVLGVDGNGAVGGDADGLRSPGRSPTRSVRDSLQAVSSPRPSATAQKPVSILFINTPPPVGLRQHVQGLQGKCRRPAP
jgi:hypothetical protein